jgi:hypothetical protein
MATQLLEAAGAYEILDSGVIQPGFRLLGTERIGDNPKQSVVNRGHPARAADGIWERRRERNDIALCIL